MKKFILTVLCVSVFFIGLGSLIDTVGAKLKSDERALALLKQARQAIGGEANINNVRSLTAKGKAAHVFYFNGTDKTQTGEFEMALQLPNRFQKMVHLRTEDKTENAAMKAENEQVNVVVIEKGGNPGGEGKNEVEPTDDNDKKIEVRVVNGKDEARKENDDFIHTMLSLFLTAPEEANLEYVYAGTSDVDGNPCEIVEAKKANDSVAKLYLSKANNLPVMISYQGGIIPRVAIMPEQPRIAGQADKSKNTIIERTREPMPAMETADINVKFSDYKTVGGVLLPFRWTQIADGKADETITIENYSLNPSDIAEKFERLPEKSFMRKRQNP